MAQLRADDFAYDRQSPDLGTVAGSGGTQRRAPIHFIVVERYCSLTGEPEDGVSVHAIYNGTRIDGRYHPATGKLEITSGVLARQVFKTPSGAAIAVVRAHNPGVKPNRNGWTFWVVTETGKLLQSLR